MEEPDAAAKMLMILESSEDFDDETVSKMFLVAFNGRMFQGEDEEERNVVVTLDGIKQ